MNFDTCSTAIDGGATTDKNITRLHNGECLEDCILL